jgi:hypothetical protein
VQICAPLRGLSDQGLARAQSRTAHRHCSCRNVGHWERECCRGSMHRRCYPGLAEQLTEADYAQLWSACPNFRHMAQRSIARVRDFAGVEVRRSWMLIESSQQFHGR